MRMDAGSARYIGLLNPFCSLCVQGSEASFTVQRAPLWFDDYTRENVMWAFIKAMVYYRYAVLTRDCCWSVPVPGSILHGSHPVLM